MLTLSWDGILRDQDPESTGALHPVGSKHVLLKEQILLCASMQVVALEMPCYASKICCGCVAHLKS